MGVIAPRSHCPGEDGHPLPGDRRHPVQRENSIVSQPVSLTGSAFSFSARQGRFVCSSERGSLPTVVRRAPPVGVLA